MKQGGFPATPGDFAVVDVSLRRASLFVCSEQQMSHLHLKEIALLIRHTVQNWQTDRAPRLGAALAYYMALSLAPTLLILLAVSSFVFGANAAEGRLVSQIRDLVGSEGR
jgi:uncharacterized BrkB/YihY/UPF0761 family membrane protein